MTAVSVSEVLDLLGVLVPMHVVFGAGREVCDPEHALARADGVPCDEPAHVHVVPPGLVRFRSRGFTADKCVDAHFVRMIINDCAI